MLSRRRIQATHGWRALDLVELWRYRELAFILALRDVQVRYRQTALGIAWALLQPLLAMGVFTVFLGSFVHVPSDGLPYALFAYIGLLPWTYFAGAASNSSESLVVNANLISKVYFPRLAVPISAVGSGIVDLAVGFVVLIVLMFVFGVVPSWTVVFLPLLVVLAVLAAFAVGVWLSALDVEYRDVRYAVPFLLQIWLFATPVVYPASVVPSQFRVLLGLNPMAGVVEGFRWALVGQVDFPTALLTLSCVTTLLLLMSGLFFFSRMERGFADRI
ncbi:MAG TPA: ABC transporter permease [Chloroflexota bacterium]|jgi:lipopolysaccharide transport system permease protein